MLCQGAWAGEIRGNRSETSPLDSWIIYRITAPTSPTLSNVMTIYLRKCPSPNNQFSIVIELYCLSQFHTIEFWVGTNWEFGILTLFLWKHAWWWIMPVQLFMFMTYTLGAFCKSCISYLSSSLMPKEVCFGLAWGALNNQQKQHTAIIAKMVVFGRLAWLVIIMGLGTLEMHGCDRLNLGLRRWL